MTNLTFERVVKLAPDLNPVVGHDLVIFEKIGAGKKLVTIVKADELYQESKWRRLIIRLGGGPSFVAYAVNMDENLALDFTRRIQPDGNSKTRPFDLEFKVRYKVSSSETLVRRLVATTNKDPLTRLQDGICETVSDLLANTSWKMILERFDDVRRDVAQEGLGVVEDLAAHLGLRVLQVNLSRRLLEDIESHGRELDRIDWENEREARRLESEISLGEKRKKLEFAKAGKQILDGAVVAINKSLDGIGEDSKTAEDLIQSARKLMAFISNPAGQEPGFTAIGTADRLAIPDYASDSAGRLKDLLNSTIDCVNQMDCGPDQRKALISTILHVVAELLIGDDGAIERASSFGEKLKQTMGELRVGGLPEDQRDRLVKFLNYAAIKELLKNKDQEAWQVPLGERSWE